MKSNRKEFILEDEINEMNETNARIKILFEEIEEIDRRIEQKMKRIESVAASVRS